MLPVAQRHAPKRTRAEDDGGDFCYPDAGRSTGPTAGPASLAEADASHLLHLGKRLRVTSPPPPSAQPFWVGTDGRAGGDRAASRG